MQEHYGIITFKGAPLTLIGPQLKVGENAPNFKVLNNQLQEVTFDAFRGKVCLISAAPSLDTPVCADQTRRFNKELQKFPSVEILTITADLPFAQGRFCGAEGLKIKTLSDHREMSFGNAYGTHIKELRLEARAIFIIDSNNKIKYIEIVKEVTNHPDYEKALSVLANNL